MNAPEVMNIHAGLEPSAPSTRIPVGGVALFALFFLVGGLAVLSPYTALGCLAAIALLAVLWKAFAHVRRALDMWQVLLLAALTGYVLLNRGFENLTIHAGIPIIVSYVMMFASLALAALSRPQLLMRTRTEPAMLCLVALFVLTCLHLVLNLPKYGFWAIRDASMFFDGLFLTLGMLWAMRGNSTILLMKWLTAVLFLNLIYCLTFPWGEKIGAWSPKSGVFLRVPLIGNYNGNAIFLLLGALFYLFLARYVVRWPRWVIVLIATAQLFGLAIHQVRALYVGLVLVLIIYALLGESRKSAKLLILVSPALAGVLLLTTLGIELTGRIGPVSLNFLKEHVRSLSGAEDTPGSKGRFDWYEQAFRHVRAHPVFGEGFGMVLIDFTDVDHPGEAAVRQPHNSTLTVLARLGAIGLLFWVIFNLCVLRRFFYAFRQRHYCDKQLAELIVWLFIVYVIFMIEASVEAGFEFPSGAIPFYFFVGLGLGLIRWQLPQQLRRRTAQALSKPGLAHQPELSRAL
jgi:O-antigen ligase